MILYFSGTGNSRFAAQAIGSVTGERPVSINKLLKQGIREPLHSERPFVFVAPTYAGRMPRIVERFIREADFSGNGQAYFVLTCGAETHNAIHYARKLCKEKGLEFRGMAAVIMPENYIAMFEVPDPQQAETIVQQAIPQILRIAERIKDGTPLPDRSVKPAGKLMSSMGNPGFYKLFVSAKGFHTTPACTSCGACAKLCALNNIALEGGKPHWGQHCTHCMACICACPRQAIEFKNKSQGKSRYYNTGYKQA